MLKRIIYCFKRSIKIFFSMLIPKTLLFLIIFVLLALLFLNTKVQAATPDHFYDDKYKTFYISEFTYDSSLDAYYADFYCYIGSYSGLSRDSYYINDTIYIPSNLYDLHTWVLHLRPTNTAVNAELVQLYDSSTILYVGDRTGYTGWLRITQPTSNSATGLKRYTSSDFHNWSLTNDYNYSNAAWYPPVRDWQPNAILYAKNCSVQFYNNSINPLWLVNSQNMTLRPNVTLPTLTANSNNFLLNMGYFYNFSTSTPSGDSLIKTLDAINITLTSLSNENISFNKDLINSTLNYDADNNYYYINFDLTDITLVPNNDDYIIQVNPQITMTQHLSEFGADFHEFDYNTIINYPVYYTFTYNDGVITDLVRTDSEGTPLDPPQNDDSPIDNINNSVNDINQFLNDLNASPITPADIGVVQPQIEGIPDLISVFNYIYYAFTHVYTSNTYDMTLTLPNGDSFNFNIPADALTSKLPEFLITFIQVCWWVVFGGAVMKSVISFVRQLMTFEVDHSGKFISDLMVTPSEYVLFNILK